MIDHYDWAGGREAMWRFGPEAGPVVIAALPLFEEANRTRTFAVTLLRALAERGVASALPDLPGQGESLVPLETVDFSALDAALQGAVKTFDRDGRHCYALGIRSGALLDAQCAVYGRWHFSPQSGAQLFRELGRIAGIAGKSELDRECTSQEMVEIAGNCISCQLLLSLPTRKPVADRRGSPLRIARYASDPGAADLNVPGTPLWRRAEPENDMALADLLADDITAWVQACEG